MYWQKYGGKTFCFSPPVMLATFLIELGLIIYVLWRYQLTPLTRIVTLFLASLATFQLSEYMLCGGLGLGHAEWVRLGFVAITLLPALGFHITTKLAKVSVRPLIVAAYASAAIFVAYFALASGTAVIRECAPNYAVFQVGGLLSWGYVAYYYGWLLVTIALAMRWGRKNPAQAPALRWMAIGYSAFIVPTTLANLIDPATIHAIPSIMCGFAILCAVILVGKVLRLANLPLRSNQKATKKTT